MTKVLTKKISRLLNQIHTKRITNLMKKKNHQTERKNRLVERKKYAIV